MSYTYHAYGVNTEHTEETYVGRTDYKLKQLNQSQFFLDGRTCIGLYEFTLFFLYQVSSAHHLFVCFF